MLFNSFDFLLFFPAVTLVYFVIPHKVRYLWLLVASYYFYMSWNPKYAVLIATSTVITFLSGILIEKAKTVNAKKWCVAGSFVSNLAILFFFKYFNFASDLLEATITRLGISYDVPSLSLLLPVGISFYTFQALSYTLDVYRGDLKAEKNIAKYALFVSFFPQLVAGPIERSKNLLPQFNEVHNFDFDRMKSGLQLMLWGLFQKMIIADRSAIFVNEVYNNIGAYNGIVIFFATVLFAFQIYCDFAGYSNIAIGAARVMGFKLMQNFNSPYFAISIPDFWKRWHISLTSWFRDYLYIPLGGNRKGTFRKYLNTAIVFVVSGLWHGARLNFVAWGIIHAVFQVASLLTEKKRKNLRDRFVPRKLVGIYKFLRILMTFGLTTFAWIFFRANNLTDAFNVIRIMLTQTPVFGVISNMTQPYDLITIYETYFPVAVFTIREVVLVAICIVVMFAVEYIRIHGGVANRFERLPFFIRWPILYIFMFLIIIFGVYGGNAIQQFIYFQF